MKNNILTEKLSRLHFNQKIRVNKLTFNIAPDTGNTWVFYATIKTKHDQEIAQRFAEKLGMAISANNLKENLFVAWCTDDTYTYLLPLEIKK